MSTWAEVAACRMTRDDVAMANQPTMMVRAVRVFNDIWMSAQSRPLTEEVTASDVVRQALIVHLSLPGRHAWMGT